jgi:hypothetical protein
MGAGKDKSFLISDFRFLIERLFGPIGGLAATEFLEFKNQK